MSPNIYGDNAQDVEKVSKLLSSGEVVAIPTETVYGLAAHALNEESVKDIFKIKGRPLIDPLIVHIESLDAAADLAEINSLARKLTEVFWPGPLSIILPKKSIVPDLVTAGLPSVALRSPSHPLLRKVLELSKLPLSAPSANPFGYISPTEAGHVKDSLGDKIEHILDGGPCEVGLESTIIDITDLNKPIIRRPGSITKENIEEVLKADVALMQSNSNDDEAAIAPGTLKSHYSPRTRTLLSEVPLNESVTKESKVALLLMNRPENFDSNTAKYDIYWCSECNDLKEAAHNLFRQLRKLDAMSYDLIITEKAPNTGIGNAINDRLRRAAAED